MHTLLDCAEARTFVAWIRHRYGVFPEHGFVGDRLYPAFYSLGVEERATIGCLNANVTMAATDNDVFDDKLRQMVSFLLIRLARNRGKNFLSRLLCPSFFSSFKASISIKSVSVEATDREWREKLERSFSI